MLSPARRRQCVDHLQAELGISERRACAVAGQHRSTQRKRPRGRDDEEALTAAIIRLASQYGRYGYRRITALLRTEGWHVNAKRVQRIWWREGLKVPQKQPKRGRLWLNDGSCIRLRPCWPNHVWSYDFVMDRTHDGRKFRMLTVIDEFTRRCMAVVVERRLNSDNVLHCLTELFVQHGPPDHIRSDNGSEFTAHAVPDWLGRIGVKTLYIEPGSPWENGYNESFNSKLGCVSKVVEIGFGASPSGLSFAAVRPRGQGFRRRLADRGFPIHRLCASGFGRKRGAPRGASALFRDTAARSVF